MRQRPRPHGNQKLSCYWTPYNRDQLRGSFAGKSGGGKRQMISVADYELPINPLRPGHSRSLASLPLDVLPCTAVFGRRPDNQPPFSRPGKPLGGLAPAQHYYRGGIVVLSRWPLLLLYCSSIVPLLFLIFFHSCTHWALRPPCGVATEQRPGIDGAASATIQIKSHFSMNPKTAAKPAWPEAARQSFAFALRVCCITTLTRPRAECPCQREAA